MNLPRPLKAGPNNNAFGKGRFPFLTLAQGQASGEAWMSGSRGPACEGQEQS